MSEDITFPKKWKELSKEEQKEWIRAYYMPKARIPEPIVLKSGKIKEGMLKLENGAKIRFPVKTVIASKSNPNVVREFEFWVGKWLVTVFNDKTIPCLSARLSLLSFELFLPPVQPIYSPFGHTSTPYLSGPNVRTIKRFVGTSRIANHDNNIVLNCYTSEYVSVVGIFLKEVSPTFFHNIFAFSDFSRIVYERVVISHQFS
jgi:hypothetical protein